MVPISLPGYTQSIDSRVIAAIAEQAFSFEFPFQRDMNTGNTVRHATVVSSGLSFHWSLFPETDWRRLGT